MADKKSDIGLFGLAVMGQNLALNIADHGFQISVYNRTTSKMDAFVAENPDTPGGLVGAKTLEEFVQSLERPRKVIILVQAGRATDAVIDGLTELLTRTTSLLTAVTLSGPTPSVVRTSFTKRDSALLVPVFPVAKKEPALVLPSCPAAKSLLGMS